MFNSFIILFYFLMNRVPILLVNMIITNSSNVFYKSKRLYLIVRNTIIFYFPL